MNISLISFDLGFKSLLAQSELYIGPNVSSHKYSFTQTIGKLLKVQMKKIFGYITLRSTYLYNKFRLLVHTDLLNPLVSRICCK